jgi:hypothetical protein
MIKAFVFVLVGFICSQSLGADFVGKWKTNCVLVQDSATEYMISSFESKADMTGSLSTEYFDNGQCVGATDTFSMPMRFSFDQKTITITFTPEPEITVVMTLGYVLAGKILTLTPKQTWINGQEQQVVDQTPIVYTKQ